MTQAITHSCSNSLRSPPPPTALRQERSPKPLHRALSWTAAADSTKRRAWTRRTAAAAGSVATAALKWILIIAVIAAITAFTIFVALPFILFLLQLALVGLVIGDRPPTHCGSP
jgi:hypothetical protein